LQSQRINVHGANRLGDDGDCAKCAKRGLNIARSQRRARLFSESGFLFFAPQHFLDPAMPAIASPSEIDLPAVSFFGRTLAEYSQFFSLDLATLQDRLVLDVAGGPASFTAEAFRHGVDAVALDPLYGSAPDVLSTQVQNDYEHMFAQLRDKPHLLKLRSFPSIEAAEADRRIAAQRFLNDYAAQLVRGRYIRGALPHLPFLDRAFDLVLCAHLLFLYARRFDFSWHVAACRELVRVSAGEVRIHPVCGPGGRRYPELSRLRGELLQHGITSEVVAVDYDFFVGANSMLVLRKGRT
jgi:hypothetical protein